MNSDLNPVAARAERANCISHAVACGLAILGTPGLMDAAARQSGDHGLAELGIGLFAASMILLYLMSAVCHALPAGSLKDRFDRLDRSAIYVFIAASCTSIVSLSEFDDRARIALAVVWVLTLSGVRSVFARRPLVGRRATLLYVALGWTAVLAALPAALQIAPRSAGLLLASAVVYSCGAVVFTFASRAPFAHLAWHLIVIVGSALHTAALVA